MATTTTPKPKKKHTLRTVVLLVSAVVLIAAVAIPSGHQASTPTLTHPAAPVKTNAAACMTLQADNSTASTDNQAVVTDSQTILADMNAGQDPTADETTMQFDLQTATNDNAMYVADAQNAGAPPSFVAALQTYGHGLSQESTGLSTANWPLMQQGSQTVSSAANQLSASASTLGSWCSK
jgi:hypothetical protein